MIDEESRSLGIFMCPRRTLRLYGDDVDETMRIVMPAARAATDGLMEVWGRETLSLAGPLMGERPELYRLFSELSGLLTLKHVWEYLRLELFDRNSYSVGATTG